MKTIKLKIPMVVAVSTLATLAWADDTHMAGRYMETNTESMSSNHWAQSQSFSDRVFNQITAQQFVTDAAMGGMKEVRLSELAVENSQNNDVKSFAQRMITDHSAANQKLTQIAEGKGLDLPATNTFTTNDLTWSNPLIAGTEPMKSAYLLKTNLALAAYQDFKQLRGLAGSGREFDQAYVHDMVMDHVNTVIEFEAASRMLTDPELKAFVDQTLPTLREHLQMSRKLLGQVTGAQAAETPANDNLKKDSARAGM